MARELSAVLDHIAKIGELDLAGVPPTSHVVELTGAFVTRRAAPVAVARGRAGAGAGCRARRIPSPEPTSVTDTSGLSAAQAAARS